LPKKKIVSVTSRKGSWLRNRHTHAEQQNTTAYDEEEENVWLVSHLLQRLKMLRSLISPLGHFLIRSGNACQLFFLSVLNVTQDHLRFLNQLCGHCFCIGLNEQVRKWCTGSGSSTLQLSVSIY